MKQTLFLFSFSIVILTSCQKADTIDNTSSRPGGGVVSTTISSVKIGKQVWSSKNLDVSRYRNGDLIPQVTDPTQWANLTTGAWCWYNNDSATYGSTYGRLYNWYAVKDSRGLAPQGWHIPSDGEWNKLVKFIDASADTTCNYCWQNTIAGKALKSSSGWNAGNNGTNSSGFTALPGGFRYSDGTFQLNMLIGYWWCSSEYNSSIAWLRGLDGSNGVLRNKDVKNIGFSVRLVKD